MPAADKGKSSGSISTVIYRDSKVWLNGHYLGRHASGYTGFRYDITPSSTAAAANVLAVHVDPRHFEGWWYEGGGIYRHVWLNVADPVARRAVGNVRLREPAGAGAPRQSLRPRQSQIKTTLANAARRPSRSHAGFKGDGRRGHELSRPFRRRVTVPAGKKLETTQQAASCRSRASGRSKRLISTILSLAFNRTVSKIDCRCRRPSASAPFASTPTRDSSSTASR